MARRCRRPRRWHTAVAELGAAVGALPVLLPARGGALDGGTEEADGLPGLVALP